MRIFCTSRKFEALNAGRPYGQMISKKMVAMVGNAIYTAEKDADQLFAKAGIAQIGNYASGISESDPNSYLFFGGQTYANAGQGGKANDPAD